MGQFWADDGDEVIYFAYAAATWRVGELQFVIFEEA